MPPQRRHKTHRTWTDRNWKPNCPPAERKQSTPDMIKEAVLSWLTTNHPLISNNIVKIYDIGGLELSHTSEFHSGTPYYKKAYLHFYDEYVTCSLDILSTVKCLDHKSITIQYSDPDMLLHVRNYVTKFYNISPPPPSR